MNTLILENRTSLAIKVLTSIIAGLTVSAFILMIGNGGNIFWFPPSIVFPLVALLLTISLIFPFTWHQFEKNQKINSIKTFGILYSLIRYLIAINLMSFGWKKVFGLQFIVPTEIAMLPMNEQTGEWLTWFYFGYSNTFGLIIALIQIIGSYLLLYRKTQLLGSLILFPLMLNLTLVNIFYNMNFGALLQSIIITLGIAFLILLDYKKLKEFFYSYKVNYPTVILENKMVKNIIRLSILVISLLFTIYLKTLIKR